MELTHMATVQAFSSWLHYLVLLISFFSWSMILNLTAGFLIFRPKAKLLYLFPYFECFMTICLYALWYNDLYFWPHFLLFSALGITIQTDLSCMLISRFVSLYLVPTGIILSFFNFLPINMIESLLASILGFLFFYAINKLFFLIKKQDGLGQGDCDLMALIGAYTGLLGIWFTILFGSIIGVFTALMIMLRKKASIVYLPFGPALAVASIIFVLFKHVIINHFL